MKALKALVIGMGVLIVIGIALVGYGLNRGKPQQAAAPDIAATTAVAPVQVKDGLFATELALPKGARLEQIAGAGDRVVLRISGSEGDKLLLVDTHTGKLAGTVALTSDSH